MHSLYFTPSLQGSDPNGYHVGGRMIEETGWPGRAMPDPYRFLGRMWVLSPQGEAFPKYPPFYPAMIAVARRIGGPTLSYWINPVAGTLVVAGTITLGAAMGLGGWSLVAGLLIWLCPVLLHHSQHQASHPTSMALIAWGMAASFAGAGRLPKRGGLLLCTFGGLLVGYSAGVRYTNVLLALPLLVGAWSYAKGRRAQVHAVLGSALGLAFPWLLLGGFHWVAYGAPWNTGYAMTAEQGGFSLAGANRNWPLYSVGFIDSLLGPALALSVVGFGFMMRESRKDIPVILAWVLPLSLLYLFYYWAPAKNSISYMRFILPVALPLAVSAAYALRLIARAFGRRGSLLAIALLLVLQLPWAVSRGLPILEGAARTSRRQRMEIDAVLDHIPRGSVLIAPMNLLNSIEVEGDYILYPDEIFSRGALARMSKNRNGDDPHGLQFDRVIEIQRLLVDVDTATYRSRITGLLDAHLAAGRDIHFVSRTKSVTPGRFEFARTYHVVPTFTASSTMPESLFFTPRKGSRAADIEVGSVTTTQVRGWQLTERRDGAASPAERLTALQTRLSDLQSGRSRDERLFANEFHRLKRDMERLASKRPKQKR